MAQSTLTNFFPTVKKPTNSLFFPKENPSNPEKPYISFFSSKKREEPLRKTKIPDFFPKKSEISFENSFSPMKKTPAIEKKSKDQSKSHVSPYKPNFLINWLKKDQKSENFSHSWAYLPKELMLNIMQFLTIKENANLAAVCKYYQRCFNSIWFSYDFFGKFNFNTFTTEKQINKVFEKASRLCHIKKMKSILTGKKVEAFIKRTKLSTTLAKNMRSKGNMFEEFSIEPRNKGVSLFLTDKEVVDICESSKYSLMFISLISCQLLTEKSFGILAKCEGLQNLAICKNKSFSFKF